MQEPTSESATTARIEAAATATDPRAPVGTGYVDRLLRPHEPATIVLGRIDAVDEAGTVFVAGPGEAERCAASLVAVAPGDVGREVAFTHAPGAAGPLILGFVQPPLPLQAPPLSLPMRASVDGVEVQITAQEQLTLHCGDASITLTADGQILLRGHWIDSHSTGTQRIKGAAVRIN
jgi:hypothetical protein